jgi:cytoskeletal protein CcmA (bactofilin family)
VTIGAIADVIAVGDWAGDSKMVDQAVEKGSEGTIFIGAGVEFKGEMTAPGCATVDGKFEGVLKAKDLVVGQSGRVFGQTSVETAEIRGTVDDHLVVQSKLVLRSTGSISGSVSYTKIMVEEGGELAGKIEKMTSGNAAGVSPNVLKIQKSSKLPQQEFPSS